MTTADSFAPQRDESWSRIARTLVGRLRQYEQQHPKDAICLVAALREAEEACGMTAGEAS